MAKLCKYCSKEVTDKLELSLSDLLFKRLGVREYSHGECESIAEIDDYATRAHLMRGNV